MSLTAANAVITLRVPNVFNTPVQLQGFAADDIFNSASIEVGETSMGVDGIFSAGFVYVPVEQEYNLQADSPSMFVFEQWYKYEQSNRVKIAADGLTIMPDLGRKWQMTTGYLRTYTPIVGAGRILRPRRFSIQWGRAIPQAA